VKELPTHVVGPVRRFQVLPTLSVRPLMLTGRLFQEGWLDTNATKVEAPVELNAVVVCAVCGLEFR
jgi:hypothetical protein